MRDCPDVSINTPTFFISPFHFRTCESKTNLTKTPDGASLRLFISKGRMFRSAKCAPAGSFYIYFTSIAFRLVPSPAIGVVGKTVRHEPIISSLGFVLFFISPIVRSEEADLTYYDTVCFNQATAITGGGKGVI